MSSGRDHLLANLAMTGGVALGLQGQLGAETYSAVLAGFLLGSVWITPDLDLYGTRTVVLRAWGPFAVFWVPVLRLSRHRGRSHTFFRGPVFRLAWTLLIGLLVLVLTSPWVTVAAQDRVLSLVQANWLWALPGYFLTQWLHLLMDKIPLRWSRL